MRLTKTLYIVTEEETDEIKGYDSLGRPIYKVVTTKTPFKGEVEPYSSGLAGYRYGVSINVTNRVFCFPNEDIQLGTTVEYQDERYEVTENMKYDRHYEVLINKDSA